MPRLYIISGCNGSGKTTASYSLLPDLLDCSEFVNADEFAKSLSPFRPEGVSVQASRYMLEKVRYLCNRRADFCIETTLATRSLLRIIRKAREDGYFVTVIYLWLSSPQLAIERVASRVTAGGHHISDDTVRRRYNIGMHYFFQDYIPVCDQWMLMDNSSFQYRMVAEGSRKGLTVHDPELFAQIREKALSPMEEMPSRIGVPRGEGVQPDQIPLAHDGVPAQMETRDD